MTRNFLQVTDLTQTEFLQVVNRARDFRLNRNLSQPLQGNTIVLLFEKPSTRTRISFEVGIRQLGGTTIVLTPQDIQLSRGEDLADTARVLSGYVDGLVLRTFSQETLVELAKYGSIPIINGLSNEYHPCQALADIATMQQFSESAESVTLGYVGDSASNVCQSLMYAATYAKIKMIISAPEQDLPAQETLREIRELGGSIEITDDPYKLAEEVDFLYTDVWVSMGFEEERQKRLDRFHKFGVTSNLLKNAKPNIRVMHCLPAHKGEEISEEVFEKHAETIFAQAENRLHAQKALLEFLYAST